MSSFLPSRLVIHQILLGLVTGLKNLVDRPFQEFEKSRPTTRQDSIKNGRLWSTIIDRPKSTDQGDDHRLTTTKRQSNRNGG
jgi:hypothetical protein